MSSSFTSAEKDAFKQSIATPTATSDPNQIGSGLNPQPQIYTPAVKFYKREPLVSNVYLRVEDVRKEGIVPVSELDKDYSYWTKKITNPKFAASDEDILEVGLEMSEWIEKITGYWFYPKNLLIPIAENDLEANAYYFPAPLVNDNPLQFENFKIYQFDDSQVFNPNNQKVLTGEFPTPDFTLRLSSPRDAKVEFSPVLVGNIDKLARLGLASAFFYGKRLRFFVDELGYNDYLIFPRFENTRVSLLIAGIFGWLENHGCPEPIQRVCRFLTIEKLKRLADGDYDDDNSIILLGEQTDGHNYKLANPYTLAKFRGSLYITGNHTIDLILAQYSKLERIGVLVI